MQRAEMDYDRGSRNIYKYRVFRGLFGVYLCYEELSSNTYKNTRGFGKALIYKDFLLSFILEKQVGYNSSPVIRTNKKHLQGRCFCCFRGQRGLKQKNVGLVTLSQ